MLNRRDFLKNTLVLGAGLAVNLPMPVSSGIAPKESGKYGCINKRGEVIVRPQFDAVSPFHDGLAKVTIEGKCGFVDRSGKMVIEPWLDAAENNFDYGLDCYSENLAVVSVDWKYGYMDRSGKLVIPALYDLAFGFEDGLAYVEKGGTKGFINKSGNMVIDNSSYEIEGVVFSDGLCGIVIDGKYGCIDTDGRIVIPPISETALFFVEGTSAIKINGKWGYIDLIGNFTIKPVFDNAGAFFEGLANVKAGEKWGYIDKEGRFVISARFDEADSFWERKAEVKKDGQYLLIDRSGEVVFRYWDKIPHIQRPNYPHGELLPATDANGNWLLVDVKGEFIYLEDFSHIINGFYTVKPNGRWGLVDNKKIVIQPDFMDKLWFAEGLSAVATESGKHGFIDMKGCFVIRPQFTDAAAFSEGLAAVRF